MRKDYEICLKHNMMPLMNEQGNAYSFDTEEDAIIFAKEQGLKKTEYIITWSEQEW